MEHEIEVKFIVMYLELCLLHGFWIEWLDLLAPYTLNS
jgi:hypothetical protein